MIRNSEELKDRSHSRLSMTLGLILIILGIALVLLGAYLAYEAYMTYKPLIPKSPNLTVTLTSSMYELLNLVIKIGFLAIVIWAGSILLTKGVNILVRSTS